MSDDSPKVISFPAPEDERVRKLRALVETRAGQPQVEWELYLKDDAQKHGIEPAELRRLIQAVVKEREKKQAIQHKHERKGQRDQEKAERREREEEKRAERKKREEDTEQRRAKREAAKRERDLEALMTMAPEENRAQGARPAERRRLQDTSRAVRRAARGEERTHPPGRR